MAAEVFGVLEPTTKFTALITDVLALERASVNEVDMLLFGFIFNMLGRPPQDELGVNWEWGVTA